MKNSQHKFSLRHRLNGQPPSRKTSFSSLCFLCTLCFILSCAAAAQTIPPDTQPQPETAPVARPNLADAPPPERQTLARMLADTSWPRRAIAAVRLERYACSPSSDQLIALLKDKQWQVRAFAIRSLARRRIPQQEDWFADEHEPRVIRDAMRYRFIIDPTRIDRGVRILAKSDDLEDKMLAVELAAALSPKDDDLNKLALATLKQVILKMDRSEAGSFSSRLATVTGNTEMRRSYQWQTWLLKTGRRLEIKTTFLITSGTDPVEPSLLAQLDAEQFSGLEQYMAGLGQKQLDLAILLDCTASMGGALGAAQGGIDDIMLFAGDMVASLRIGLVAYRDRGDKFQTKAWDFTSDIAEARDHLWELSAEGGGDSPEAVHPAMKLALTQLNWRASSDKTLIIVGDAPPHIGYGALCIEMAHHAREQHKLITHAIQARGKDVKHFPEIARAGGGRCVSLLDDDNLIAEITGLTLGDRYQNEFREFFQTYLELCR